MGGRSRLGERGARFSDGGRGPPKKGRLTPGRWAAVWLGRAGLSPWLLCSAAGPFLPCVLSCPQGSGLALPGLRLPDGGPRAYQPEFSVPRQGPRPAAKPAAEQEGPPSSGSWAAVPALRVCPLLVLLSSAGQVGAPRGPQLPRVLGDGRVRRPCLAQGDRPLALGKEGQLGRGSTEAWSLAQDPSVRVGSMIVLKPHLYQVAWPAWWQLPSFSIILETLHGPAQPLGEAVLVRAESAPSGAGPWAPAQRGPVKAGLPLRRAQGPAV